MSLEEKISKLEALIKSTTHEGEKTAAILARDRLLNKLKNNRKKKHHSKHQHRYQHKQQQPYQEEKHTEKSPHEKDDFFSRDEVTKRDPTDTDNASKAQKNFIRGLMKGHLVCPAGFLSELGLRQATRIIELLIEMFGDPRKKELTDEQYYYLMARRQLFGLTEELIEKLTSSEARKIIAAVKIVESRS